MSGSDPGQDLNSRTCMEKRAFCDSIENVRSNNINLVECTMSVNHF